MITIPIKEDAHIELWCENCGGKTLKGDISWEKHSEYSPAHSGWVIRVHPCFECSNMENGLGIPPHMRMLEDD